MSWHPQIQHSTLSTDKETEVLAVQSSRVLDHLKVGVKWNSWEVQFFPFNHLADLLHHSQGLSKLPLSYISGFSGPGKMEDVMYIMEIAVINQNQLKTQHQRPGWVKLYSISYDKPRWKTIMKMKVCVCVCVCVCIYIYIYIWVTLLYSCK